MGSTPQPPQVTLWGAQAGEGSEPERANSLEHTCAQAIPATRSLRRLTAVVLGRAIVCQKPCCWECAGVAAVRAAAAARGGGEPALGWCSSAATGAGKLDQERVKRRHGRRAGPVGPRGERGPPPWRSDERVQQRPLHDLRLMIGRGASGGHSRPSCHSGAAQQALCSGAASFHAWSCAGIATIASLGKRSRALCLLNLPAAECSTHAPLPDPKHLTRHRAARHALE